MKRLVWLFLAIPVAVFMIVFSVTNRAPVTLVFDPFSSVNPAFAVTLPLFVFLFIALLAGLLTGGLVTWVGQGHHRREKKRLAAEVGKWRKEAESQKNRADALAGQQPSGFPAATGTSVTRSAA
jgi:uncharacterized integral membrane protein